MGNTARKSVFALTVLGLIAIAWFFVKSDSSAPLSHREIATRVLAAHLRDTVRPRRVLVISNPYSQMSGRPAQIYAFEKAGIRGLASGFSKDTESKIVFPRLKPEVLQDPGAVYVDPKSTTPLSFLIADNAFEEAVLTNGNPDIIVSLIGLPLNLPAFGSWNKPGPPQFALLLPDWRMIGGRDQILGAFKSGKLVAAIVNKPHGSPEDAPASSDYRAEFAQRFFLVTSGNIEELLQNQPELFSL